MASSCCAQPPSPSGRGAGPARDRSPASPLQSAGYRSRTSDRAAAYRYPARAHDDRRREVFFDRRHSGTIAIAAQVQAFAAQIQRDVRRLLFSQTLIRRSGDSRSTFGRGRFLRVKLSTMASLTFSAPYWLLRISSLRPQMHREGGARVEHLRPRNGLYAEVQIQIAVYATFAQRQHDARSQPAPHQALIQQARIPEMDPPDYRQSVAPSPSSSVLTALPAHEPYWQTENSYRHFT